MSQTSRLGAAIGKYRWTICSLVFFATTINYLDRQVISLLKADYLEKQFHWSESDYANIVVVFQIAYSIGMVIAGWFIDKVGTKIGYAVALAIWSLAAIGYAFAASAPNTTYSTVFGVFTAGTLVFMLARAILGISEAGNFPAAIKTIAEWFPKKERALATGIFNSGSNVGAIVAPLTVPAIALAWGWEWAFIITGTIGLLWLLFWYFVYDSPEKHKRLSKEEYAYILSDAEPTTQATGEPLQKVSWGKLLGYRQTWGFVIGKLLTDPVWWFYLFWLPSFLKEQYGMEKTAIALPIAVVYTMTTFGSIIGGWLSSYLIGRGWEIYKARKTAMLIFALAIVPVVLAQALGAYSPWFAILIVGLAASAHQAWSANIFTTASDMFPKRAVASITGLGGMAGGIGGILLATAAGRLFDHFKALGHIQTGYYIMFLVCGSAYVLAWFIYFVLLVPRMKPVEL
jgi:ACS family hexuronate transporter-like MFS transporter